MLVELARALHLLAGGKRDTTTIETRAPVPRRPLPARRRARGAFIHKRYTTNNNNIINANEPKYALAALIRVNSY